MKNEKQLNILLIEDNPSDARLISELLKDVELFNYQFSKGGNLKEGIEQIRNERFDVVLLDLNLPDSMGQATFEKLHSSFPEIPIILTSGMEDEKLALKLIELGAQDYINKSNITSRIIEKSILHSVERNKLLISLQKSEEFTQRIISSSNDCIKELDLKGNLLSMSEGGQKSMEIDELEPYLNKSWVDFWKDDDHKAASLAVVQASKGNIGRFSGFCPTEKGTPKWWEVIVSPIKDAKGKVSQLLAISRDITSRTKAENELKSALIVTEQKNKEVSALLKGAHSVIGTHSFEESARSIFDACSELIGSTSGYVALLNENGDETEVLFLETGGLRRSVNPELPLPIRGLQADAYSKNKVVWQNDFMQKKHLGLMPEDHAIFKNVLFAPLAINNKVVGILGMANKANDFSAEDAKIANAFGELAAMSLKHSRQEEALYDSEEKFKKITEAANKGIIMVNNEGKIVLWNEAAEKIFGYKESEALNHDLHNFLIADKYIEKSLIGFDKFRETGKGFAVGRTLEWEGKRKNGEVFPVELSISAIKLKEKWNAVGIVRDISDRKEWEKRLIAAKEEAQENEASLRNAQEIAKMGSWNYDVVNNKIKWSENMFIIFGLKPFEIEPTYEYFLSRVYPDDLFLFDKFFDIILKDRLPVYFKLRIILPNGNTRWIQNNIVPIFDDGKLIHLKGINIDITEHKHFEQELIQAKEKAEESDRLKSTFLANMSHEIRTPMNGILGFTDLLREPNLNREDKNEYLEIISKSGERLLNTINNLLDISRIESGEVKIYLKDCNVKNHSENLYSFFKPEVEKKGMNLIFMDGLPAEKTIIKTDPDKFDSILTNLIKNAIKYSHSGSIEFGYHLKDEREPAEFEFYVKDNGIGIQKSRHDAIFDRFAQADIEERIVYQGNGLGLAITKSYVEMLGGKIWVESEEGKGSTFFFTIPFNNELDDKKQLNKPNLEIKEKHPLSKLKILLAEDDEASAELMKIALAKYAKELITVGNGKDAIETCTEHRDIDLVFMDIQMPVLNGYDATSKIREFNKEVVIIAQTAFALTGDREKAINAGCNDYISKPINRDKLAGLMRKYFK